MTPERFKKITQVLEKRQPDLTVITDQIHKQRNISAIVRTCDAVGIDKMYCVTPKDGFQLYSGTAASADKWVEVVHCSDVSAPLKSLAGQGYQIVGAQVCDKSIDYRSIDYTRPTALVMGAELAGLSKEALAVCTHSIMLPMLGMVESYNVSVACALILNEAQRQREEAGLYSAVRLLKHDYKKRFIQWAHPKIAQYCDQKGLSYPDVREDGEVVNFSALAANIKPKFTV